MEEKSLRIAVVGLTREELKKEFNVKQLNNRDRDIFTDGVNTYFYINDELPNTHGREFDKVYDLRLLKSEITFDLMSRLSNYPNGYYIGREKYGLVFVQEVLERLDQQNKRIKELEENQQLKQAQKQARREVVEEIREKLKKAHLEIMSSIDLYSYTDNFLCQVEKEIKGE